MKFRCLTGILVGLILCCIPSCLVPEKVKYEVDISLHEPSMIFNETTAELKSPLEIAFSASAAPINFVEQDVSSLITISPAIQGTWSWMNDSYLKFVPKENWALGTKYKITFNENLFSDNVIVDSSCSFKTVDYKLSMTDAEFFIDPEDTSIKRVTFSLQGNAPFETENLSKKILLKLKSRKKIKSVSTGNLENIEKEYSYTISFNENKTIAYIVSEPIPMPQYTSDMNITVESGIKSIFGGTSSSKKTDSVVVPGISDYVNIKRISHSLVKNDEQNYDQIIFIETKGQVSAEELGKNIAVYELPADRPKEQGYREIKNYSWNDPAYVTELVLSQSKKIDITMIPTPEKNSSLNSFKIKANPQKYVYIKIAGNIDFYGGYKWNDVYEKIVQIRAYPKELGILSEGTILSLSGSKKMSLYSRGVNKVAYSVSRIMPKDIHHLISMSNGNMKNFEFSTYRFDEDNISEKITSTYSVPGANLETISYFSYDFTEQLKSVPQKNLKNGLFIFSVRDERTSWIKDKRLILITDLGFFVKQNANKTKDIFVQSIATGEPVGNAKVLVLGVNGNPVYETVTNSLGHASISDLSGLANEHEPIAYIVETENDLSFMPYRASGRKIDYSNFDVGGIYGSSDPEKINAYLFNDRGIYRPGDEIHIGMILKSGDWKHDLHNIPLEISVIDSKGTEMFTKQFANAVSGFNEVTFSTKQYSPTGEYTVNLYLLKEEDKVIKRGYLASTSVNVEEFLPDTLTLQTGFEPLPSLGWIDTDELLGTVSLRNLFGTPACGNVIKGEIILTPGFPSVKKYSDYTFSDPYLKENSYKEFLEEIKTDEEGKAKFAINLEKFEKATYQLTFFAEAFEKESGRSVSKQSHVIVSPLQYMIGYKADGSLSYINSNSVRKISFIAIDKNLEKINLEGISLIIEEQKYVSSLVKQPNGLYKYQSVKKAYPVSKEKIAIAKDGYDFVVPADREGEFTITLVNEEGLVFNKINYTVVGDKNISRSLTRNAELEITLEDSDLAVGEKAKLFIKAPYAGSGLITIERDKVYTYKWFKTSELSTTQTIEIPAGLEGNGYVTVMFTRSAASEEIFMSPFCYGTVPFSVNKDDRTSTISLNVPAEIKSGEEVTINYSTSEKGKIVVFAIDEGILQVGRYKTPDPLAFFFQKRALEVSTSQILDLVLPDFNVLKTVAAYGGGAGMDMLKANLNPFSRKVHKPVAFWSGILDADQTTRSVTYTVPDYFNGSIRVMAVAVSPDTVGAAQVSTVATNAFIMVPNNPLVAAPGDEFDVSVVVTNNFKGSGENAEITITLENSEHVSVVTDKTVTVTIPEGKDEVVRFVVKAEKKLGNADLRFIATGKNLSGVAEKTVYTSTLSVRPSMPYKVWIESGVTKGNTASLDVKHTTYDEYAQRKAVVSNMPTSFVDGLNFYLEKYPHGCSEQVVSKTYPYIYKDVAKLAGKSQEEIREMVQETMSILQARSKSDGNIGYWTNKSKTQDFITLYCAEFLTDAQQQGFTVPLNFMSKVLTAVRKIASDSEGKRDAYIRAYAIYILTRNEEITTQYIEDLEKDLSVFRGEYEKLYLAASYKMMMQGEKAEKLYNAAKFSMLFDSSWEYHNELHYNATYIDIVSTYFPEKAKHITQDQVESFCNRLKDTYYNSLSTSAAYKALYSYSSLISDENNPYTIYQLVNGEEKKLSFDNAADNKEIQYSKKATFDSSASKIIFKNDANLLMYYQTVEGGFETTAPATASYNGIEVYREYCKPDGSKLADVKIGETIMVKIHVRSSREGYLNNVAVIDLACAGLESDIESIRKSNSTWKPDYVDIREDRVVLYGTVTDRIQTFTYLAKAISSGTFVVPSLYAESMYNGDINGICTETSLTISK